MNRILGLLVLCALLFAGNHLFSQVVDGINYQAVVVDKTGKEIAGKDINGNIIPDKKIHVRFTILEGSSSGTKVYQETQYTNTDINGLISLVIGKGTVSHGTSLSNVSWGNGKHYLKVEIDINGGSDFELMGIEQMYAVPYALYGEDADADPNNELQTISKSGNQIILSNGGGSVTDNTVDSDADPTNELQNLSISGSTLSISPGNSVNLPSSNLSGSGSSGRVTFWNGPSSLTSSTNLFWDNSNARLGIGTTTPSAKLHVNYNSNGYIYLGESSTQTSYFYHNENSTANGQSAIYAYRTRTDQNNGNGYGYDVTNNAIIGYNYYGDLYTFGIAGFNWNDNTRCGGILGARYSGAYWGSLGYKNSGSTTYGGYFNGGTGNGGGKNTQPIIGIGIGAWGDLFGADIHGKVYGIFSEGENYALFSNGKVFKNDLDIHLQKTGNENTILYTNVSTSATVMSSGYASLVNGECIINFDKSFNNVISSSEPVVVTVTPIGNSNGIYLAEVNNSGFKVVENNNGKSNLTFSYIAVGKRSGYENPKLPKEVVEVNYITKLSEGLHNDGDTVTNGQGLYYENGELKVGIHPSTIENSRKNKDPLE